MFNRHLALLAPALLLPGVAQAATCTSSATTNNWNTTGTWSCGHVPAAGDDVVIASGSTTTLNINSNALASLTVNGSLNSGAFNLNVNNAAASATTINAGGTLTASGGTATLNGNVTVNGGTFSITGGTVNIGGVSNTIRLILNNSATTSFSMSAGALNVTGGINSSTNTAAGTFTMSGGTMTLQTVNAGPQYTLLLGSATTFNWSGGTIVAVNGNNTTDDIDIRSSTQSITGGTLQLGSAAATSTNPVSYINGAGGQLNVWDLVIGGPGGSQTISWRSSTNILDDLTIQSGNTLQAASGFAISIGAGNSSGDWINNGTFTPSTTTVTFTGSGNNQVIGGTMATTFYNLTFNKSANDLTLNTNATASNSLTFTSGDVITGTNTLISSGNCATLVSRTSGHVIGNLRLTIPNTNPVTCTFHVGDSNNYAPITITKTGTNTGTLTGSTTVGDHADTTAGTSGINASLSVNRYWTLTTGTLATGTPYSATFQFCNAIGTNCVVNDVDTGANTSNFIVAKKTSGTWSLPTVGTRTGSSTQATGLTTFGEFAVGEAVSASVAAVNFDCIETGLTFVANVRHPLYTKLASTAFSFDIVALKASGAIETNYVSTGSKNVTVELFDDTTPAATCSAYASPIATQTVTVSPADAGRKVTAAFTLPNAYAKLRCRVRDAVPVYGCSSDDFTVRPTQFTAVTSTANSDPTGASATSPSPIKAGSFFTMAAQTGLNGYSGTPAINAALMQWTGVPTGGRAAPGVGTVSGSFSAASAGTASGSTFAYDEVGYFQFLAQGVYDDAFANASSDIANGDCTNDFSNTLVGGKYGCKFGNTAATNSFGRFIPDHFAVAAPINFVAGCGAFTYMSQNFATPLAATIQAQTLGNARTQNYSGAFAKGAVTVQLENANSGTAISTARLTNTGAWSGGNYAFSASAFLRGASVDGPYSSLDIGVGASDESSSVLLVNRNMDATNTSCTTDPPGTSSGTCTAVKLQTVDERYGRFHMGNAFGSELLPLSMMAQAEYYNGAAWVLNSDDSCTTLAATPTSPQALNPSGSTALTCNGATCTTASLVVSGDLRLRLAAPNTAGYADIPLTVPAWLQFAWAGFNTPNPSARATFGIYKGNQRLIYRRERY